MARYKIDCCMNCPDRYPGCHGKCERYITQKAELEETQAQRRKKYEVECRLNSELYKSVERTNKWLHKKGR